MNIQASSPDKPDKPDKPYKSDTPETIDTAEQCFHCGDDLRQAENFSAVIHGQPRAMCCAGCQAVAETIVDAGLDDYYKLRTSLASSARQRVPDFLHDVQIYAEPVVADQYLSTNGADGQECSILLRDIECTACCWLIERRLSALPGIHRVSLNYSNQRARIDFDPEQINLEGILSVIARLGYRGIPYERGGQNDDFHDENKARLKRLGIAGLFGMQVMMMALALYTGSSWGMADNIEQLLRWSSLLLSLPIIGYCAQPFFTHALRSLRNRSIGMDIPVSLGILIAFSASTIATVQGHNEIYFDTVAMFVCFLLAARYLEFLARQRAYQQREQQLQSTPEMARRITGAGIETVAVASLELGDHLRVLSGDSIPADAKIISGTSSVDESLLSGESRPVTKQPGDEVIAGSVNLEQPLDVCVTALGSDTVFAKILELVDSAVEHKPRLVQIADKIAGFFVTLVLILSAGVAVYWLIEDPENWLRPTIAVLIVTCPCALSLATPAALTAASGALARLGIIPGHGLQLEHLAAVTHLMFDKTGTLTHGNYALHDARALGKEPLAKGLVIAAAMESHSLHPIAKALMREATSAIPKAENITLHSGQGIQADVEGQTWWLGSVQWTQQRYPDDPLLNDALLSTPREKTVVVLADDQAPKFIFTLIDSLRPDAANLVRNLHQANIQTSICSGDHLPTVTAIANQLGISDTHASCLPADKLSILKEHQRHGQQVAMLGDGINDAPVLAGAHVSFAMGCGVQAAKVSADFILLGEKLGAVYSAIMLARKTRRVIWQNLSWAVIYNLVAVPAAASGWLTPWMAAIGMSLSSLLVVANSLRCNHTDGPD